VRLTGRPLPVYDGTSREWLDHDHIIVGRGYAHLWELTGNPHMPYRTTRIDLGPAPATLVGKFAFPVEVVR
jgi:hypothetical protein